MSLLTDRCRDDEEILVRYLMLTCDNYLLYKRYAFFKRANFDIAENLKAEISALRNLPGDSREAIIRLVNRTLNTLTERGSVKLRRSLTKLTCGSLNSSSDDNDLFYSYLEGKQKVINMAILGVSNYVSIYAVVFVIASLNIASTDTAVGLTLLFLLPSLGVYIYTAAVVLFGIIIISALSADFINNQLAKVIPKRELEPANTFIPGEGKHRPRVIGMKVIGICEHYLQKKRYGLKKPKHSRIAEAIITKMKEFQGMHHDTRQEMIRYLYQQLLMLQDAKSLMLLGELLEYFCSEQVLDIELPPKLTNLLNERVSDAFYGIKKISIVVSSTITSLILTEIFIVTIPELLSVCLCLALLPLALAAMFTGLGMYMLHSTYTATVDLNTQVKSKLDNQTILEPARDPVPRAVPTLANLALHHTAMLATNNPSEQNEIMSAAEDMDKATVDGNCSATVRHYIAANSP